MRTSHESIQQTTASISIFDTSGIEINPTFGDGTQFCMCYTVAHTSGSYLDICLLVGGSTEIRIRDAVAVRIQSPQTNSKKALPQCKDVDTESYISTALIATNRATPTSNSGNSNVPSNPVTASNSSNTGKQGRGLSTEAIIGLSVGLPGALVAIGTLIGFCWKTKRHQAPAPGFTY